MNYKYSMLVLAICALVVASSCGKQETNQSIRKAGTIRETLFDGNIELVVRSFEQDMTQVGRSPVTFYEVQYSLKNQSGPPLVVSHIETEFMASDLVESVLRKFGSDAAEEVKPFKNTYAHTRDPNDPNATTPWIIAKNETENVRVSGHFYFAQNDLSCRITLFYNDTVVAGPFTVTLRPSSAPVRAAETQGGGVTEQVPRESRNLRIEYGYEGRFGIYGIADTASAFDGSVLVAKAKAVKIIEKDPGPNHILIEEEHYGRDGKVVYKGTLEFQFGFGGGTLVAEKPVSGKKRYNVFGGWPAGH